MRRPKFLVLRRDGTVPDWTWFVLGAADPAAPAALSEYAHETRAPMCSKETYEYADHVYKLSREFEKERLEREKNGKKKGDPEAPPHRVDDPLVLALMRGEVLWEEIAARFHGARSRETKCRGCGLVGRCYWNQSHGWYCEEGCATAARERGQK